MFHLGPKQPNMSETKPLILCLKCLILMALRLYVIMLSKHHRNQKYITCKQISALGGTLVNISNESKDFDGGNASRTKLD